RVYLISSVHANTSRLLEVDPQTGTSRVIAEDSQYDVGGLMRHPRDHRLEAVAFNRARREWVAVDASLQSDFDAIRGVRDGDFSIISRDREDRTWVVAYVMDNGPIYYYLYDRGTKQATLLFS